MDDYFEDLKKCARCGKEDFIEKSEIYCDSCKNKKFWEIGMLIVLLISLLISPLGYVQYNYQIDKCKNLDDTTYEFDHKVELNAEYGQDCYYVMNHPLALFWKVFGAFILSAILGTPILALIHLFKEF